MGDLQGRQLGPHSELHLHGHQSMHFSFQELIGNAQTNTDWREYNSQLSQHTNIVKHTTFDLGGSDSITQSILWWPAV